MRINLKLLALTTLVFIVHYGLNYWFLVMMRRMVSAEGGPDPFFPLGMLQALLMTFVFFAGIVSLVELCFKKRRKRARIQLALILSYILSGLAFSQMHESWVDVRKRAFSAAGERLKPLIVAIEKYHMDHHAYPPKLNALIPKYLSEIPATGMRKYSTFYYQVGEDDSFDGNPWAICMNAGWGLGFDSFLYYPLQNYPETGYGGVLEPMGGWAYVYE